MAKCAKKDLNGVQTSFYDVSHQVGYGNGSQNLAADVTLVQYLLTGCFRNSGFKPLGNLSVDGRFGPMTHYWSLFFQLKVKGAEPDASYVELGDFLPTNSAKFGGSASWNSMMYNLNYEFRKANPHLKGDLETSDPGFPGLLKGQVSKA